MSSVVGTDAICGLQTDATGQTRAFASVDGVALGADDPLVLTVPAGVAEGDIIWIGVGANNAVDVTPAAEGVQYPKAFYEWSQGEGSRSIYDSDGRPYAFTTNYIEPQSTAGSVPLGIVRLFSFWRIASGDEGGATITFPWVREDGNSPATAWLVAGLVALRGVVAVQPSALPPDNASDSQGDLDDWYTVPIGAIGVAAHAVCLSVRPQVASAGAPSATGWTGQRMCRIDNPTNSRLDLSAALLTRAETGAGISANVISRAFGTLSWGTIGAYFIDEADSIGTGVMGYASTRFTAPGTPKPGDPGGEVTAERVTPPWPRPPQDPTADVPNPPWPGGPITQGPQR